MRNSENDLNVKANTTDTIMTQHNHRRRVIQQNTNTNLKDKFEDARESPPSAQVSTQDDDEEYNNDENDEGEDEEDLSAYNQTGYNNNNNNNNDDPWSVPETAGARTNHHRKQQTTTTQTQSASIRSAGIAQAQQSLHSLHQVENVSPAKIRNTWSPMKTTPTNKQQQGLQT